MSWITAVLMIAINAVWGAWAWRIWKQMDADEKAFNARLSALEGRLDDEADDGK